MTTGLGKEKVSKKWERKSIVLAFAKRERERKGAEKADIKRESSRTVDNCGSARKNHDGACAYCFCVGVCVCVLRGASRVQTREKQRKKEENRVIKIS